MQIGEFFELTFAPGAVVKVKEIRPDAVKITMLGSNYAFVQENELVPTSKTAYALPDWVTDGAIVLDEYGAQHTITAVTRSYICLGGQNVRYIDFLRRYEPNVGITPITPEPEPEPTPIEPEPTPAQPTPAPTQPEPTQPMQGPSQDAMSQAANLLFGGLATSIESSILHKVMVKVQPIIDRAPVVHIHEFNICGRKWTSEPGEIFHPKFDEILFWLTQGIHVWIWGPAGTGKTHCAMQLARALHKDFKFCNRISDEFQLTGFVDGNGNYNPTPYYDAFISNTLFLFDECDGSSEAACLTLNSSLDNRMFDVPKFGNVKAHEGFVCVAAGNTPGLGATEEYNGRTKLDAAFMQRFGAVIEFDYDPRIEEIQSDGDVDLLEFTRAARIASKNLNIADVIISYRNINALRIAAHSGFYDGRLKDAIKATIWRGLDVDSINNIRGLMNCGTSNKYFRASAV